MLQYLKTNFFLSIFLIGLLQGTDISKINSNTDISGQWFLAYNNASDINQFALKRGYFTIKTRMNDVFSVRYTQDITLDKEGDDAGNVEIRLKYLYLKMKLDQFAYLKNSYLEIGLVHRPWLDFEQKINRYRVQGKMFLERYKIISSADFGIFYTGLIGGNIDSKYQTNVTKNNPGKYGSYSFGIHNGGGYHAIEKNNNKTFEGRLTARPFHSSVPGLQLTYAFTYGKANTPDNISDFILNLIYLSHESKFGVFTGQYFEGTGDFSGKYIDDTGNSYSNTGYSIFSELNIPCTNVSIFSRYDEFELKNNISQKQNSFVGGISYNFLKNKILFDVDYQDNSIETIKIYEIAFEIGF